MKASELRDKTTLELNETLVTLAKDQFSYRMQQSTGQLGQTHLLKAVRKDIARVKTALADEGGKDKSTNEENRANE